MPRAQPSAAIAAPVPFLLQPRAILLAFILIATGFVVALAGSCIDLVAYRLLTDGVLTLVWLIAAGGIGRCSFDLLHRMIQPARKNRQRSPFASSPRLRSGWGS